MKEKGADAVTVAQKRRHLHLLEKLRNGKTLAAAEMNELKKLEDKKQPKQSKGTIEAEQLIKTQAEAARYVGVSERTIRRWIKNGMARTADKYYIKSILEVYKQNEGDKPSETKERKQEAEAQIKTIRAEDEAIDLAKKKGEMLPKAEVDKGRIERIFILKRSLLGLGREFAPELAVMNDPRQIQAKIDGRIREIINAFAEENVC